jgi:hexokinase
MPKNLQEQIKRLEDLFIVPREKLVQITDHFVAELNKGTGKLRIVYAIC